MHVEFDGAGDYFVAQVGGEYSLDGMRNVIDRIAEQAAQRRLERVLISVASVQGDASISDRLEYAAYAAETLKGIKRCAAYAGGNQKVVPLTALFAHSRGLDLEVFGDRAEAVSWLLAER
jgi:hypothetical protein